MPEYWCVSNIVLLNLYIFKKVNPDDTLTENEF